MLARWFCQALQSPGGRGGVEAVLVGEAAEAPTTRLGPFRLAAHAGVGIACWVGGVAALAATTVHPGWAAGARCIEAMGTRAAAGVAAGLLAILAAVLTIKARMRAWWAVELCKVHEAVSDGRRGDDALVTNGWYNEPSELGRGAQAVCHVGNMPGTRKAAHGQGLRAPVQLSADVAPVIVVVVFWPDLVGHVMQIGAGTPGWLPPG